MNKVLVIGSINMDMVFTTASFPALGETLSGQRFNTFHGGKGANQAVAARRLGAEVSLVGCVGADAFGRELVAQLTAEGIDTRRVRTCAETRSGVAAITVSQAENTIIVIPGANHALTIDDVFAAESDFVAADVILSQLEIPLPVVEAAAGLAALHGKPFLLNPAPAVALPAPLLEQVALLTPNEHELGLVFADGAADWARTLSDWRQRIIMTRGADGAWFADARGVLGPRLGEQCPPRLRRRGAVGDTGRRARRHADVRRVAGLPRQSRRALR